MYISIHAYVLVLVLLWSTLTIQNSVFLRYVYSNRATVIVAGFPRIWMCLFIDH